MTRVLWFGVAAGASTLLFIGACFYWMGQPGEHFPRRPVASLVRVADAGNHVEQDERPRVSLSVPLTALTP